MKKPRISVAESSAIVVMIVAVSLLGYLQYRSTGEISQADEKRLEASLAADVRGFDQQFAYDIERLCESFELDPEGSGSTLEQRIADHYETWIRESAEPELVKGVELWRTDGKQVLVPESLDPTSRRFRPIPRTGAADPLQQFIEQREKDLPPVVSSRNAVYYPWFFVTAEPALVRPVFQMVVRNNLYMQVRLVGFLAVRLNKQFLARKYLPELAERYFGGSGFAIAVRSAQPPYHAVYESELNFPVATTSPDAITNLVDAVGDEAMRRGHPPVRPDNDASQWQLVVQNTAGSLNAAVSAFRARNLAISFGLLGILAGCMALIFSVMRRAEKLTKLQMEFVASVSHELCTPLSVIKSAAENLSDGIVENPKEIREYAEIIRDQGRRLENLVDQSLSVAAGKLGQSKLVLGPLQIAPIVRRAIEASEPMFREAHFTIRTKIRSDLPLVMADPDAIEKCMENLLSNAVKYAGNAREVAVTADVANGKKRPEVRVSVQDKGIGIPAEDLPNLFEPFYRVPSARESPVRGTGLGLYLVKKMMEGMGGRVTVSSNLGYGTCFVLHFPIIDGNTQPHS